VTSERRRLFDDLARHAVERPSALAAASESARVDYATLDRWSRVIAVRLEALGVGRGSRVAVFADKSPHTIAALYGVMRAGAAYVPISSDWPAQRRAWVVRQVGAAALLVHGASLETEQLPALPRLDVAQAIAEGASAAQIVAADARAAELEPEDLAYVLFTSGSTGDPKGVMHSHGSALAFVDWAARELELSPDDRLASHAPLHFDLSILDLYAAARAGACVVIPPPAVAASPTAFVAWLDEVGASICYSVPGVWIPSFSSGPLRASETSSLRRIIYAGEPMAPKHVAALQARYPRAVVYNFYGPTETNVCTSYRVPPLASSALPSEIPIGTACSGDEVTLTDGELLVRGGSVFLGYWGAERHPPGSPYCTGDLARWDDARAAFVFIGRRDGMRKLRGFRIELGEVEACLLRHEQAAEAVAVVDARDPTHPSLIAFVVPSAGAPRDAMELKRHCAASLPPYMVPRIEWRERLPLTSTGKIDRRALEAELSAR
jgi:amino acid adenylation domain-containing protein